MLHYLFITSVAFAQTDPPKDKQVSTLLNEISVQLSATDILQQKEALRLLGNLRTSKAIPYLKRISNSSNETIRVAHAEALLLTPRSSKLTAKLLESEKSPAVRATLLLALAKHGKQYDIKVLLSHIKPKPLHLDLLQNPKETAAALHGLGMMLAIHKDKEQIKNTVFSGQSDIIQQLNSPHTTVRQAAAFVLSLLQPRDSDSKKQLQKKSVELPSPNARSWLIKAIQDPNSEVIKKWYQDPSPQVRRAAIQLHPMQPYLSESTQDRTTLVRLTAIEKLASQGVVLSSFIEQGATIDEQQKYRANLENQFIEAVYAIRYLLPQSIDPTPFLRSDRPTLIRTAAIRHIEDQDKLLELATKDLEVDVKKAAAKELLTRENKLFYLERLLKTNDPILQTIALSTLYQTPYVALEDQIWDILQNTTNIHVEIAALQALATIEKKGLSRKNKTFIEKNIRKWDSTNSHAIYKSVKIIRNGRNLAPVKFSLDENWQPLDKTLVSAIIKTKYGNIIVELWPHIAPTTVSNFAKLTEEGYYNGQKFHRVIADFVAQTGESRYEHPGWTIKDELSAKQFQKGTLGMALFDRDTGGSQFFITLSPQPHLVGEYPAFGKVVQGLHILDQIKPHDIIEKILLERY